MFRVGVFIVFAILLLWPPATAAKRTCANVFGVECRVR